MALQEENLSSLGDLPRAECPSYLKWGSTEWLRVPAQQPYFIGRIVKVNRKRRKQKRVLVLTRSTVASCRMNGKVTRAFPVRDVTEVWVQDIPGSKTDAKQVVLKVPSQYDLHFYCEEQQERLLIVLSALLLETTGSVANVRNIMTPQHIGQDALIVHNAKPPSWKKGQHLVYVDPRCAPTHANNPGDVELVEVSDSDDDDGSGAPSSPGCRASSAGEAVQGSSAASHSAGQRSSLRSSFGAPVGSQVAMPAIHQINL